MRKTELHGYQSHDNKEGRTERISRDEQKRDKGDKKIRVGT